MSTVFCIAFRNTFYRVDLFIIEFCNRGFVIDFAKIQPLSVLSWSILFLRTLTAVDVPIPDSSCRNMILSEFLKNLENT